MRLQSDVPPIKIRTKVSLLTEAIDQGFFEIIERLHKAQDTPEEYKARCLSYFDPLLKSGELDALIARAMSQEDQLELVRRHLDDRRYTVLLYRVEDGEVHAPHHHFNVISTQIVVRGKIRIREYDRMGRDKDGHLLLKLVSDTVLEEGGVFQASEWSRNVHWFSAIEGPALIFNTNARGFENDTFDADEGNFGRRYVDPTQFDADGIAVCEEFGEEEAVFRFGQKSLDDFPSPTT